MRPNQLKLRTSKFILNACVAWLTDWADPERAEADPALHRLGIRFLTLVLRRNRSRLRIRNVEALPTKDFDHAVLINGHTAIVFACRAGTQQRPRLRPARKRLARVELGAYVTSHEQWSYAAVRGLGFAVVRRRDLLALFDAYVSGGGCDPLALGFRSEFLALESRFTQHRRLPSSQWDPQWDGWMGALLDKHTRSAC